jgi:hypothetical protein
MTFTACKDWLPGPYGANVLGGTATIDATGEMFAFVGRVMFPPGTAGPKDIRKVQFRFGSVTKSGGSGLTVSLQDVDTANGPLHRPDGTPDQTVAIANGNASFATSTWITTGNLSADRTVALGELLAVVIEYDGSGRLSSDSVQISFIGLGNANQTFGGGAPVLFTASWANSQGTNNVVLEFSDGTFGTLEYARICSATTGPAISSSTTPDEVALKWTPNFNCKVSGAYVTLAPTTNTNNFDVVLYEGTTPLQTVSVDSNALAATGVHHIIVMFPETELTSGTAYYLAYKPTTTGNSVLTSFDVAHADHLGLAEGGTAMHYASRTDAGAWTPVTTRRPDFGFLITAREYDTGAAAGGMVRHPGMAGGLNG